nr:MAG TPA: hypothetical protein [Caudoviricetes sp.]
MKKLRKGGLFHFQFVQVSIEVCADISKNFITG